MTKQERLEAIGLIVGKRDPRRNTAFTGEFMVAEPISDERLLPTEDAMRGGFCIVGNNLDVLIQLAVETFEV
jgi:hypothetical protein